MAENEKRKRKYTSGCNLSSATQRRVPRTRNETKENKISLKPAKTMTLQSLSERQLLSISAEAEVEAEAEEICRVSASGRP